MKKKTEAAAAKVRNEAAEVGFMGGNWGQIWEVGRGRFLTS